MFGHLSYVDDLVSDLIALQSLRSADTIYGQLWVQEFLITDYVLNHASCVGQIKKKLIKIVININS